MQRINTKRDLPTQAGIAPIIVIIIVLLAIGGGGYAIKKGTDKKAEKKAAQEQADNEKAQEEAAAQAEAEAAAKAARTLHIKLDEQNKSGQNGEATIMGVGTSSIKVIVSITGKPSGIAQPAHIHVGACPTPGLVKYPLMNIEKGASQTEIPITLDQLISELPLAINVHKSAADSKTYTACGNIEMKEEKPAEVSSPMPVIGSSTPEMVVSQESKKETKVNYTSAGFSPKTVTIKKGDTVVFENKTGKNASVASDEHPTHLLYPEFDQYKTDQRGKDEFRFTFTKTGTWGYHDHLNASQGGTVIVTE